MAKSVEVLKNRINLLQERDPIGNQKIISKLKRKVRAQEKNTQQND